MEFVGRSNELKDLEKDFESDNFSLAVIYGRRRVGKTELIKKFCSNKQHIYHLATQDTSENQRKNLEDSIAKNFDETPPRTSDWDDTIKYVKNKLEDEKLVLAIDELPYIINSAERVASKLQKLVEEIESSSMLILCGSSISVMESQVLGHKSPLYGRRTLQIDLKPFNFRQASKIIQYKEFEKVIESFSITGGVPMYLNQFDYSQTLGKNIEEKILSKNQFLHGEPEFLLRTELRNPSRYTSILKSIANGHTTPNEISNDTNIDSGPLSNYLNKLRRIRLIKREIPVTASQKKSKRSIYKIKDNFFRFWFRFIEPHQSSIEEKPAQTLENLIEPSLSEYTSQTFEDICLEATWQLNHSYTQIGRWWYKEYEIDIVGLNPAKPEILLGECKWTEKPVNMKTLKQLESKAEKVRWKNKEREEKYILYSKNGFTEKLADNAKTREDLKLVNLKTLQKILENSHS